MSLSQLHHHLKCVNKRIPVATQLLKANRWILQALRWTKSRHDISASPDIIMKRLFPQLMKLSSFGTTRIIEVTRDNRTSKMIEYVKPGTIPASIMRINDGIPYSFSQI